MKKILIFGSTGSIGKCALQIIRQNRARFRVVGVSAHQNITLLQKQIEEFRPSYVCVSDPRKAKKIKTPLPKEITLFIGSNGLEEFATLEADVTVMGIVGISALKPLLINIPYVKRIALVNKEAIITAGKFVFRKSKEAKTEIIPVDSEINALFQLLKGLKRSFLKKVYLTASGGPLPDHSFSTLSKVTKKTILSHPTWQMGKRITVDSATLVNKGFEVIETHYFFNIAYERIGIVIHPQSVLHGLVETIDGMNYGLLYPPDMSFPIRYALFYPERICGSGDTTFFQMVDTLHLREINPKEFPLLQIILEAAQRGDNYPIVMNAVDEIVVEAFLSDQLRFIDIYAIMEKIFLSIQKFKVTTLEDVFFWDDWGRKKAEEYIKKYKDIRK